MSALALQNSSRSEPGFLWASVLALLVHVIFAVLMFFGLSWKTMPPEGMVVDIWHDLPKSEKQESVRPKPIPQPDKVKQELVRPQPIPQPSEVKKDPAAINIKAPQPPKKPEIVLKEKKPQPEPNKDRESAQVDQKNKEQERLKEKQREKKKRIKEKQRKKEKAEAVQQQREQEVLAQQAAAHSRLMNEIAQYKAMILAKIKSRIVMPPDLPGNPVVEFNVTLLPGGDILDAKLLKSSGYAAFDRAVERAIFLSNPLPLPSDSTLFSEFRNLNITAHYQE